MTATKNNDTEGVSRLIKLKNINDTHTRKLSKEFTDKQIELINRELSGVSVDLVKLVEVLYKIIDRAIKRAIVKSECKRGCDYCCSVAVAISNTEANYISKKTGVEISIHNNNWNIDSTRRDVCPFLVDRQCSIYEHRPAACRVFHTMDSVEFCKDDAMPSHAVVGLMSPGQGGIDFINYIYHEVMVGVAKAEPKLKGMADIRDYFPNGLKGINNEKKR